jgi:hypothetical protein
MFAPLTRFLARRPDPAETDHVFVRALRVEHPREPRSRRSEWFLGLGWVLIVGKCLAIHWAIHTYTIPIHPGWLIIPTLAFAVLCTWIYWRRD